MYSLPIGGLGLYPGQKKDPGKPGGPGFYPGQKSYRLGEAVSYILRVENPEPLSGTAIWCPYLSVA